MNKRKLLSLALSLSMVAILAVGGTLAYFTDTDAKVNTFTVGNIDIELVENFGDNNPETPEELVPATGSAQAGTLKNGVTKEVSVKNTGSKEAYVRVHIAIPNILDDGAETFDASANLLHFNYDKTSVGEGKWDWSKTTGAAYEGDWNYYEQTIDGVLYNVYVVTFESSLDAEAQTCAAMTQVYLDKKVSSADMEKLQAELGTSWNIEVKAEGAQVAGFENAYDALNMSFGIPTTDQNPWVGYPSDTTTALPTT